MAKASRHHIDQVLAVVEGLSGPPKDKVVWESWVRSARAHGVNPGSAKSPRILTISELRYSIEASSQLIDVARAEIDQLYKVVRPAHYVVLLCDKDGRVIEHRGENADAGYFRKWGVWLGGVWSEDTEGTNGIGTAIADGRAVTVHRSQHFRARHIDLSCSGAPVFDDDGQLLGVLDVSSIDPALSEHAHALTGALTIAAARGIEERLFRKKFHRHWIIATGPGGEPGAGMLISVDRDHRIVGTDQFARRVAPLSGHELEKGALIWAAFERNDALFRHPDRGDVVGEIRLLRSGDCWPVIVTPPEPALAQWSQPISEEARLRPRLDKLALSRVTPERARGGLASATLRRVRDYVDSHLEETIDLESLASTAELSLYHFARAFRQSEGMPPHAYVLERRVAKARDLLSGTDLPLSQIALAVGFADQSHFARRFRQSVGVSPGQFRKSRA